MRRLEALLGVLSVHTGSLGIAMPHCWVTFPTTLFTGRKIISTLIASSQADLAALSLKRAKEAPLEICLDMDSVKISPGFPDTIAPYLKITKTLRFSRLTTIEDLTRTLPELPGQCTISSRWNWRIGTTEPTVTNPSIHSNGSPTLRETSLYDIDTPLPYSAVPSHDHEPTSTPINKRL